MNTSVQAIPFNFNSNAVRVINQNGNAWFVASDVSDALGYRNANDMTRVLDEDEADTHSMRIRSESGVEQARDVLIINESGLYHALFKSRKKEAVVFRKWVTSEVLPSIRKTGEYKIPQLATPAQKLQIRRLVEAKAKNIGGSRSDYSIVWRKVHDVCGGKLEELTPAMYLKACKFFDVEPLLGEWEHEQPATITAPAPMFSGAELHIFTAFLSTFTKIAQKSEILLEVGQKLDSPVLIHLWSQIDHANFMIGSMEKMARKLNAKILMH